MHVSCFCLANLNLLLFCFFVAVAVAVAVAVVVAKLIFFKTLLSCLDFYFVLTPRSEYNSTSQNTILCKNTIAFISSVIRL